MNANPHIYPNGLFRFVLVGLLDAHNVNTYTYAALGLHTMCQGFSFWKLLNAFAHMKVTKQKCAYCAFNIVTEMNHFISTQHSLSTQHWRKSQIVMRIEEIKGQRNDFLSFTSEIFQIKRGIEMKNKAFSIVYRIYGINCRLIESSEWLVVIDFYILCVLLYIRVSFRFNDCFGFVISFISIWFFTRRNPRISFTILFFSLFSIFNRWNCCCVYSRRLHARSIFIHSILLL